MPTLQENRRPVRRLQHANALARGSPSDGSVRIHDELEHLVLTARAEL